MNEVFYLNGSKVSQADLNRFTIIKQPVYEYYKKMAPYPTRKEYVQKMVSNWRRRLHMESLNSASYFGTLTFSQYYLPMNKVRMDALKSQVQKFWKRFRYLLSHKYPCVHVKYYLVSERGDKRDRLHYHFCLFLSHPIRLVVLRDILDRAWKLGRTNLKMLTPRMVNYVTKYIHKRYGGSEVLSLKSNGIGMSYVTPEFIQRQKRRNTRYINIGGRKLFLPRYVWLKIYPDSTYNYNRKRRERIAIKDGVKSPIEMGKPSLNPYIADSLGNLLPPSDITLFYRINNILNH